MTKTNNIYFELFDTDSLVRLEPIERINNHSDLDWDKNWIKTQVTVRAGKFSGQYSGEFMTIDFEKFKQELSRLYNTLDGTMYFKDLEGYLEIEIKGDGIGHFEVKVKACDQPGIYASELSYTMTFDQTEIKELVNQLNKITAHYPIADNLKTKSDD